MSSPRSQGRVYRVCIALGLGLFRLLGLRRQVWHGDRLPTTGGAVLAFTHFGYMDFGLSEWMVWVQRRRLVRYLVTKAAWDHWAAGPLLKAMQHIPVNRRAGRSAYEMAVDKLRAGELVGVFPEAQVNLSWTVRSLKTGAVRMAAEAGVPIIPVAIWGGHRVITKKHPVRLREAWRAPVIFAVGEPMHVPADQDVEGSTYALHDRLQALVDQAQRAYPVRPPPGAWWQPAHLGGSAPTAQQVEPDLLARPGLETGDPLPKIDAAVRTEDAAVRTADQGWATPSTPPAGPNRPSTRQADPMLKPGDKAPDFELPDQDGSPQKLSTMLADGPVVLFFYPAAMTGGCTAEACHFRDIGAEFTAVGAHRVGISFDTVAKQKEFADKNSFDYPLLSDSEGAVAEVYGVRRKALSFLTKVKRATFVIDEDGTIKDVITAETKFDVHADKALAALR